MSLSTSEADRSGAPSAAMPAAAQRAAGKKLALLNVLLAMVVITAVGGLLYSVQYYLGGPIRVPVTTPLADVVLVPGGTIAAAARQDGVVQVWDLGQNWSGRLLRGHQGPVTAAAFVRGSYTLITVGQDGTIRQWNAATGQAGPVTDGQSGPLYGASLSSDGSRLATTGRDGHVRIWDVKTWQLLQDIAPVKQPGTTVAISADGKLVAAGDGPNLQVWDVQTGQPLRRMEGKWDDPQTKDTWLGHRKPVTALAFSPDGTLLASGAADASFVFWDVATGQVNSLSEGHYGGVTDIAWSSDGTQVLTSSRDTKIRSWRMPGGKILNTFEGQLSTVTGVTFGPQANTLLSSGDDGTVRLWDMTALDVTHVEWTRYGLLPIWGRVLAAWFLASGVIGLVAFAGLRRGSIWSHLLALGLFLLGPIVVVGLPLLEVTRFPISWPLRLQVVAPLLFLIAWYGAIVVLLTREPVTEHFQSRSKNLAEYLMTSRRTSMARVGLYGAAVWLVVLVGLYSVLRRFNLDVAFMGHFFPFIMAGAGTTLYVSALSIVLAVVLALFGALGRLAKNPIANGISSFYISLIRGTPLLVQVYIWYLGLPRVNIVLPAIVAGVLALGVNYGAYMTETFRAGIQAIGKGQHEAAQALGMTGGQTFRRIVLPQAFRIVIPPIGNDFIAMMKDSSLVSIMAVWELTFRAQKIGRQYFRSLETLIVAAAFYWALTVIFQFLQGKLETYMARSERR